MTVAEQLRQPLDEAIRSMAVRPKMHPHAKHKTLAGPARHVLLAIGEDGIARGRVYVGMRKYGYVDIAVVDTDAAMKRFSEGKPRHWWRYDPGHARICRALARYRRDRYARDLMNAITTAWRA